MLLDSIKKYFSSKRTQKISLLIIVIIAIIVGTTFSILAFSPKGNKEEVMNANGSVNESTNSQESTLAPEATTAEQITETQPISTEKITVSETTKSVTKETEPTKTQKATTEQNTTKAVPVTKPVVEQTTEAITEPITEKLTEAPTIAKPTQIAFLGDSITASYFSDFSYAYVCCKNLGASEFNYGISGSTIASDNGNGFVERFTKIYSGVDTIVVYGGSNDYYNDVPMGSISSTSKHEFFGALNIICAGLKENYPNAKVIFITPLPGQFQGKYNSGNNNAGFSMYDYALAIKQVCNKYSYSVLDLYSGFKITNDNFDRYTVDGLHPNEDGHTEIGKALANLINNLYK